MGTPKKQADISFDLSISSYNTKALSDDLLIEILTRLPLKPLFRFNCVSKAWHSLISDDYLIKKLPLITSGVYYDSDDKPNKEPKYACISDGSFQVSSLDFFPFRSNSSIIDCSNGLLLCYSSIPPAFYICNPLTKRWFALPKPSKMSQLSILAYDPSVSPYYKVVCFTGFRTQGSEVEIFSSETGEWVEQEVHWGIDTDTMSATMHYFDGALYVLAYPQCLVGIDLEMMNCLQIELPEAVKHEGSIGRNGGRLHYTTNDGTEQRIWMLEDSSSSKWVLKHSIRIQAIHDQFPKPSLLSRSSPSRRQFSFLAFHPELEVVYIWVPGKLISYDMRKKRFEDVCSFGSEHPIQISLFPVSDCLASGQL